MHMGHVHGVDMQEKCIEGKEHLVANSTARRRLAEFVKIFGALLSASVLHAQKRDRLFRKSYFIIFYRVCAIQLRVISSIIIRLFFYYN